MRGFFIALALALLLPRPVPAHGQGAGAAPSSAELMECRFLSLGAEAAEVRKPLEPEHLDRLLDILRVTRVGTLVASELDKFQVDGVGGPDRPLRTVEVSREGGPAAEYFESGELAVSSSLVQGLGAENGQTRDQIFTAASFVVHEGVHAIAHHLHLQGRFPLYRADTKVNEALAYFIQGLFLDELWERFPEYRETEAVPAWDLCTARIVRILRDYGITRDTPFDDAYDRFAEWQLEAEESTGLRLAKLWQYFQFIHSSGEAEVLWGLEEASLPRVRVVETLTGMIATDVEHRSCNLERTFSFMRDRIILYGHYADTPPDSTACQYFGSFARALRSEGGVSEVLRQEIDRWLARRGLGASAEKTP
jgi:hypothetical protein